MPNFNGQGPEGNGPMTGRGLGRCLNRKSEPPNQYTASPSHKMRTRNNPNHPGRNRLGRQCFQTIDVLRGRNV